MDINSKIEELHSLTIKLAFYKAIEDKKLPIFTTARGVMLIASPSRELQKIIKRESKIKLNLHAITRELFKLSESSNPRKSYYVKDHPKRVRGIELSEQTLCTLKALWESNQDD